MNYKKIYETAYLIGVEDDWDDEHAQVACPVYDLWVDDSRPERFINFAGAAYEDYEPVEKERGAMFGYSLVQAGLVADNRISHTDFEEIHRSDAEFVATVTEEGDITATPVGEYKFTAQQAIRTGLMLIERFGEEDEHSLGI